MIKITTSTSDIRHQRFILMIKITTSTSDILHQRYYNNHFDIILYQVDKNKLVERLERNTCTTKCALK